MSDELEPRTSPLFSQIILWVVFALIVVASIVTVVVPELRDQSQDEDSAPAQAATPAE